MKKRLLMIGILFVIIIGIISLILIFNKPSYIVKVSMVDDNSPDRLLTVYKNNEIIEVRKIMNLNGTILCEGYNTAVHFSDIENEDEVKIILEDKTEVVAKIVKEEVKE